MAEPIVHRFLAFLDASPSPFHAAKEAARQLEAVGYRALDERAAPEALQPGAQVYVLRAGSLVAFRVGADAPAAAGFRIVAAHTDSPNLRVKPQPVVRSNGYVRLGLEPYGGVILATWTDRDLGLAGRVLTRDGDRTTEHLIDLRRPLCRIPNLAIHLDRKVNDDGLKLNAQTQLPAVFALADDGDADPFRALLAEEVGCEPGDLLAWDLGLYDLTPATLSGANHEFLHSARLDNLASCHAGLEALLAATPRELPAHTAVLALFDHEEIGSRTSRGADGALLGALLDRVIDTAAQQAPGGRARAFANSWLVSADMAHAVHPAHADRHDPEHMPRLGKGPVIKQNVNARYATEADGAAMFVRLCERVDAPHQWFVTRSDLACGSTVGPMVASLLGVRAVDVGNPMLSMHSARELCGAADHAPMVRALGAFFGPDPAGRG